MMSQTPREHRWQGSWLMWSRLLWAIVSVAALTTFVVSLPYHYALRATPCPAEGCANTPLQPSQALVQQLVALGLSERWYAAWYIFIPTTIAAAYCAFAILLIWRRPEDRSVWLFSLILVLIGTSITPATDVLASLSHFWFYTVNLMNSIMWVGVALLFYTFPDGRFVPTWSWLGLLAWIAVRVSVFLPTSTPLTFANWPPLVEATVLTGIFLTFVAAQIYRYRRVSSPLQRQQTKWIVLGLLLIALVLFIANFADSSESEAEMSSRLVWEELIGGAIGLLIFLTLPLTLTIAILRYRLWDVDLIIRRTLIYGVLSVTLALVYFGGVALLQQALGALIADTSELAVVGSTLAIAVLFNPLRHRVQTVIDRRFYRRKYDAEQVLAEFSAATRSEVELDRLAAHLMGAVDEALQPATVSIWLRTPLYRVRM